MREAWWAHVGFEQSPTLRKIFMLSYLSGFESNIRNSQLWNKKLCNDNHCNDKLCNYKLRDYKLCSHKVCKLCHHGSLNCMCLVIANIFLYGQTL